MMATQEVFLIRHGETEWSLNGRHTGVSDIPLTENGRQVARLWQPYAAARTFALVLSSPLQRARQTCELAGLGPQTRIEADLREWDYGGYEGLTPQQIRAARPDWLIFRDGCPDGESADQVGARVDRVIARIRAAAGDVAVFAPFPARDRHVVCAELLSRRTRCQALERAAPERRGAASRSTHERRPGGCDAGR
jgi:probable phosphoglycerate mutase